MNITIKKSLRIGQIEVTIEESITNSVIDGDTIKTAYDRINAIKEELPQPQSTSRAAPSGVAPSGDTLSGTVEYCALKQGLKGGYYVMKIITDDDVEVWAKVWSSNAKYNHRKGDRITYSGHYEEYNGNTNFIIAQSKQEKDAEHGAPPPKSKPTSSPDDDLEDDDVPF